MTGLPERILAATDFSPTSECALSLAKSIARRFEAELHLVHVRQVVDDPTLDDALLTEVEHVLRRGEGRTAERLASPDQETVDLRFQGHVRRSGSVALAIVDMVDELGCNLVVTGTHGRTGFKHLIMGSVAEKVMRLSPVPVLSSREDAISCDGLSQNILVAYDFSDHSLEALRWAEAWARPLSAKVTLLHAIQPLVYHEVYALEDFSGAVWQRVIRRCQEALEGLAAEHLHGLEHAVAVVEDHPTNAIVSYATEHRCDLVVVATRGLSGLEHVIVGSVAERVARLSPAPVLSVR
jgi:nucleotide-binding universal stress UspA family protein